ncbi:MAG TPA: nucleotidyltransferase domain-containing protein [Actinomycetota bacterium]|nr:nucleotidyltransferase domain-containing protein [Actinomycetota bacterium]
MAELTEPSERALEVARSECALLVDAGAEAVFLTGSHARGQGHPESDLDVRVLGDGSSPPLKRHDEFLVSTSWSTRREQEDAFRDPAEVGEVVPGWRSAVVLHDPDGIAAEFKRRAESWTWDEVAERADAWVAEQVTDYAEEVHTLVSNAQSARDDAAAAIRSQLAMHVAKFLAVRHRLLYESENQLWTEIATVMGDDYTRLQRIALGVVAAPLERSCEAALELFVIAARDTRSLLDDTQRAVVEHASSLRLEANE